MCDEGIQAEEHRQVHTFPAALHVRSDQGKNEVWGTVEYNEWGSPTVRRTAS